ncbi:MAG: hypothetical protein MJ175_11440 [Clostridia bacterium]|nr:hypothetical protein [Clostridia bacterium]
MYARNYPPGRAMDRAASQSFSDGMRPLPRSEEILIPQNYHGEMLRSRREEPEPFSSPQEQFSQSEPVSDREMDSIEPSKEEEPLPFSLPEPYFRERSREKTEKEDSMPTKNPDKTLSGGETRGPSRGTLAELFGSDTETILLLAAIGFLIFDGRREHGAGEKLLDGDDLEILMILFLLIG